MLASSKGDFVGGHNGVAVHTFIAIPIERAASFPARGILQLLIIQRNLVHAHRVEAEHSAVPRQLLDCQ